ncbi:MAG: flagellar basal body P-ring formation protein FlgA [Epsilonproteobacteria bacterium]|nr:flagellar basal body P-ring formation protein FlgA [Campylobacterota bacterium]
MKKTLFFLLLAVNLFSAEYLKKEYFVSSNDIYLSTITHDTKNDMYLFSIERDRYLKRVSAKRLLQILQNKGYRRFKAHGGYVTFYKKSNVDLSSLKEKLKNFYEESYQYIQINDIQIVPRNHLEKLPKSYVFKIQPRNALHSHGNFSIKDHAKQIFFEYFIDADLYVFKTKRKVLRGELLDGRNIKKVRLKLDKFQALPVQQVGSYQAKHHINKGRIVTRRDIEKLALVKRGQYVTVIVKNNNMEIIMGAKALQSGSIGEKIEIQNEKGIKLHAKVIGKNRVEVDIIQ